MRGLTIPPKSEDFTADPVELFFDLAFVFAFSQLVSHLVHHPDWTGVAEAGLLFLLLWFVWSIFTWSANAVSGNARSTRIFFLIATAAMVPMAATVGSAFDAGGSTFAVSGGVIMAMGIGLQLWGLPTGSEEFRSAVKFGLPSFLGGALMVVGGFLDGTPRTVLWIAAFLVVFAATLAAGSATWIVRAGHFAERHGLIIIIALGEVIVAIGIAVVSAFDEDGLTSSTRIGLTAAGALAGLLWWSYFDRVLPALEHRGNELQDNDRSRFARDAYTFLHMPIVAGIILAAAAAEEFLLHPDTDSPLAFRLMFAAGIAGILLGAVGAAARAYRIFAFERAIGAAAIAVLVLVIGRNWDGVVLLIATDIALLVILAVEHLRIEQPSPT